MGGTIGYAVLYPDGQPVELTDAYNRAWREMLVLVERLWSILKTLSLLGEMNDTKGQRAELGFWALQLASATISLPARRASVNPRRILPYVNRARLRQVLDDAAKTGKLWLA